MAKGEVLIERDVNVGTGLARFGIKLEIASRFACADEISASTAIAKDVLEESTIILMNHLPAYFLPPAWSAADNDAEVYAIVSRQSREVSR